jgi:bloom syndrome protein
MALVLNRDYGISAKHFHAQMPEAQKAEVLRDWKSGVLSCVCATVAFGMVG